MPAEPPIFAQGANPSYIAGWFRRNWLVLSERMTLLILAICSYFLLYPSRDVVQVWGFGWVILTYFVNLGFAGAIAGSIYWYFYMNQGQGKTLEFDGRGMTTKNRAFLFSDQVKDNMFWNLVRGVTQLTAFQVVMTWLMANGYAPTITLASNLIWFVFWIVLLPVWSAFHFYWVHRLLHVPFLYTRYHSLQQGNTNIGPWQGFSVHLVVHWILASHPIHLIFQILHQSPGAAMTHTGYEDLLVKDKRRLALGTFCHTLHHRYFECNYGNQEMT